MTEQYGIALTPRISRVNSPDDGDDDHRILHKVERPGLGDNAMTPSGI